MARSLDQILGDIGKLVKEARLAVRSNGHMLSTAEAAELLGIKVVTVRKMAQRGEIPHYKLMSGSRGFYRFKKSEIQRVLKRGEMS